MKGIVPHSVLLTLYNSFIQSHLNYCSNVWGLGSKASVNKIFIAQKRSIRALALNYQQLFYGADTDQKPCHTKEIFNKHKIFTIHNLIAKNCLILMHKTYLNVAPNNINKMLVSQKNVKHNNNRLPLIVSCSANNQYDRITLSRAAKVAGADWILCQTPNNLNGNELTECFNEIENSSK